MRAQRGKVLGNPGRREIERGSNTGHILFAATQLLDEPDAVRMGEDLEQVGHFLGNDEATRNDTLPCISAKLCN